MNPMIYDDYKKKHLLAVFLLKVFATRRDILSDKILIAHLHYNDHFHEFHEKAPPRTPVHEPKLKTRCKNFLKQIQSVQNRYEARYAPSSREIFW